MAKSTLQDYEFLQCEDGIYFGRALKNGSISKDSRKLEFEEIAQLFSIVAEDFILRNQQPLVIQKDGKPFLQTTLIIQNGQVHI